jgi:hypothetical protein
MFAYFQSAGTLPRVMDLLNNAVTDGARTSEHSFKWSCYQKKFKKIQKKCFLLKLSLVCVDVCESKNRHGRTLLSHRISSF